MEKVSIVIPNYNGRELLEKNLPAILQIEGIDEVVIIDDGSTDNSIESIKHYVSSIKYKAVRPKILRNERNLGFSSTVNRGVEAASGEIVVLLNTDVAPKKNFLNPLLAHFKDPQVFAVGCLDKDIENGVTVLRGRGVGRWERGFLIHSRGEVDKTDTLWVAGGSGAFRKELWRRLGGMEELYNPFYWEDIDLSYRAQKAGYKILFDPESVVIHRHEEGTIKQRYSLSYIKTIAYRNQFIFVWKNIDDFGLLFDHLFWLPYHLLKSLMLLDFQFFKGFFLSFGKLPQILASRQKEKHLSVKKDREILAHFT